MKSYQKLIKTVLSEGLPSQDRLGAKTLEVFGAQIRFDLAEGFPATTIRTLNFKAVVAQLLWALSGSNSVKALNAAGITSWNTYTDPKGELGSTYGQQWRAWDGTYRTGRHVDTFTKMSIDQIENVLNQIKNAPESRFMIVSSWNVGDVNLMPVLPAETILQFNVRDDKLDLSVYHANAEVGVVAPFSFATYALLLSLVAHVTNKQASNLIMSFGHLYAYEENTSLLRDQLKKTPTVLPKLVLDPKVTDIDEFEDQDIVLENYSGLMAKPKLTEQVIT